jgi:phospholipid transport system transporter-binding protein
MLVLPSQLTHRNARESLGMLLQGLERETAPSLTVDATGLSQFDTSVLAVLLECKRQAQARGLGFELAGAPVKLGELARLYGVQDLLSSQGAEPGA